MQLTLISQMSNASDAQKIAAKLIPATNGQEWEKMAQDVLSVILKRGFENGMDDAAVRNIMIDVHGKARQILRGTPAESIIFDDSRVGAVIQVLLNQSHFAKTNIPAIGQPWPEQGGIYIGSRLIDGVARHVVIPGGIEHDAKEVRFDDVAGCIPAEINGYTDWRAPDLEELMLAWIHAREHFVQDSSESIYWTSTEHNTRFSWAVSFESGITDFTNRLNKFRVRPFRSFIS